MKTPSPGLIHALIGKSIVETLLIGALAVVTFMTVLPPYFHGWGEVTNVGIAGWAVNDSAPWSRVEVHLYVDDRFVSNSVAELSRPDVLAAGWAKDEWNGYSFKLPILNPGRHEARVYALHDSGGGMRKTLQLLGDPLKFSVDADGRLTPEGK